MVVFDRVVVIDVFQLRIRPDHENGALEDSPGIVINSHGFAETMGLVGQQFEIQIFLLGPVEMAEGAIDGDAKDGYMETIKICHSIAQRADFFGAT